MQNAPYAHIGGFGFNAGSAPVMGRLVCGAVCRILPESVVWLCAQDRTDDAERIIRNAAKLNNITMPDSILARKESGEPDEAAAAAAAAAGGEDWEGSRKKNPFVKFTNVARLRGAAGRKKEDEHAGARYTLLDVFRNLRLALYCICMSFLWSVCATYFLHLYGHTMRKQGSCLEKEIMQGTMPGARRRGRPHTAWMDNIKTCTGLPVEESVRMTGQR